MSIKEAVLEIDSYVAHFGWDGPLRLFALIRSSQALKDNPELASQLPADVSLHAAEKEDSLFSVEQEDLPSADSLDHLLAQIAWPEGVYGAALSVERVTLPPHVEESIPDDPQKAEEFAAHHPEREDIRMIVGVTREGDSWCTIRVKSHDDPSQVLSGENLIPELVDALKATFDE